MPFDFLRRQLAIHHVDVQLAVQVIQLVADRAREQPFDRLFAMHAVAVLVLHGDFTRAGNDRLTSRQRQAAFAPALLALAHGDDGVDEFQQPVPLIAHINHDHAAQHPDLRRRQPDALRLIHRVRHILQQDFQPQIKLLLLPALLPQAIIANLHNLPNRHKLQYSFL